MADKPVWWMDLAYYGMRWMVMPSRGKQFILAIGETASNETALSALGFRLSEKLGVFVRVDLPEARTIKSALPQVKWFVLDDPKSVVIDTQNAITTAAALPVVRVALPRDQRSRVGHLTAAVLNDSGLMTLLLAPETAQVDLRLSGEGAISVSWQAPHGPERARLLFAQEANGTMPAVRTELALDGAGQLRIAREDSEKDFAATLRRWLMAARGARASIGPFTDGQSGVDERASEAEPLPAPSTPESLGEASAEVWLETRSGTVAATIAVDRWRVIGDGSEALTFADVRLTRADGTSRRAAAIPVASRPESLEAMGELFAAWGREQLLGHYRLAAAASPDQVGGVIETTAVHEEGPSNDAAPAVAGLATQQVAKQETTHVNTGETPRENAAGATERSVPADYGADGEGAGETDHVSRSPDPERSGNGSGPRARARLRTPVRRDDDTLLFGGLSARAPNFRLTDPERVVADTWNERDAIDRNLGALRTLKRIEGSSDRAIDEADQDALIRYVGWGGLPGVFAPGHHLNRLYAAEIHDLVGADGFAAARASTVNAHYTAVPVVDAIWSAVLRGGFTGGRGLEPGAGTGLFLARVPDAVAGATRFIAIEKDPATGAILSALYPQARVHVAGYEETPIPNNSVDLVIGNVPFGEYRVYDEGYKTLKAMVHDYFIVKSLDKLRPGGVLACITSTGTLDKQNPRFREAMYEKADLVAACRLPNDVFQGNANTSVTTDVVFFRKRSPDDVAQPFDWRDQVELKGSDGLTQWVNGIFATERGQMLGYAVTRGTMYGGVRNTVERQHPKSGAEWPMARVLKELVRALPQGTWAPKLASEPDVASDAVFVPTEGGAFAIEEEGNFQVRGDVLGQIVGGQFAKVTFRNKSDATRVLAWIPVRDAMKAVLRVQVDASADDLALHGAQAYLGLVYDQAAEAFGPVSTRANRRALADDPDLDILLAAEDYDDETGVAVKTEVFTERTLSRRGIAPTLSTPADGLLWCIDQHARVLPDVIAAAVDTDWDVCRQALRGQIFKDPDTGEFDISARYLAGNVRAKLRTAERAAQSDASYQENVAALRARVPEWLSAPEIDANLGQPWLPTGDIAAFVLHLYDSRYADVHVAHNPITSEWALTFPKQAAAPRWSTPRFSPGELVELALRGQMPKVYDKVDDVVVLNPVQTAIAIEKQKEIREEFGRWIWSDLERTARLEGIYNEKFRSHRSADYSGLVMTVPGMAITRKLRPFQARGVARVVMEANTLLAHPVGFGKTATMVAAAMKLKSLQIANKSMIVVRKNTLYQMAAETKRWFPEARVLMIRSEDLNPKGRLQFWRRVQTRNPDIILVTPEAFKRIRLPRDAEVRYLNEEVSKLEMALAHEVKTADETGRPRTRQVKNLEKRREGAKAKMKELLNLPEKDSARVTIADLGIDALFIDEAQNYKNLQVLTREQMLGIPTAASQRASDLASKTWFLQQQGKRVVFATGTPVVNTLAEIFNLQRYLSPGLLEDAELQNFDAWVAQFGEPVASLEPDPGGAGYRTVRRLAEVRNVPELVAMFAQVTDAVSETSVDLGRPTPKFRTIVAPPTKLQALYREVLSERVMAIRARGGRSNGKGEDNILAVLGDSRRAALDLRALYPDMEGVSAGGKLAEVAAQVAAIYAASRDRAGTQLVFLDFGTPGKGGWNAYDEITMGLVALGVDREEIAFIHDCKTDQAKADLFGKVREGTVRILLGSTEKMGEGTNVQDRLVALHHVNAPFHPGAVIQRNGRAIRQGNQNKEVEIVTYVTQGLLEDWNWHLVLLKERFIRQLMDGIAANTDGEGLARRMTEDPSAAMSYEEIEAMASGDPVVKEKCSVDAEIKRLRMLKDGHASMQGAIRRQLNSTQEALGYSERQLTWLTPLAGKVTAPVLGVHGVTVAGQGFTGDKAFVQAGEAVIKAIELASKTPWQTHVIANVRGLTAIMASTATGPRMELVGAADERSNGKFQVDFTANPVALIKRMEYAVADVKNAPKKLSDHVEKLRVDITRYETELGAQWPQDAAFQALLVRQREANVTLESRNAAKKAVRPSSAMQEFEMRLLESGASAPKAPPMEDGDSSIDASWGGQSDDDDERIGVTSEPDEGERLPLAASMGGVR